MLAVVEVPSNHVDERNGVSGKTGRGYSIRNQTVYLHQGEAYPEKYEIALDERQPAYEPGRYLLAAGSYSRGQYGMQIARRVKLIPLVEAHAKLSDLVKGARPAPVAA